MKATLSSLSLKTVCEEASCPNAGECWSAGTATFLLMGGTCTRGCRFCDVPSGASPPPLDPAEPARVAGAVDRLGLDHVVLTSVDRDDLPDGGAAHFAAAIRSVRALGRPTVEALTPDFGGCADSVREVGRAAPHVLGQNLETVRRLTSRVRDPRAGYDLTLDLLGRVKREFPSILTKSSLLLGLGETAGEVREAMRDLRSAGVELLTLGQYLQPSPRQLPVAEWITPERFASHEEEGYEMGFQFVASGPLVRSSYRAAEQLVRRGLVALALASTLLAGGCAGRPVPPTARDPRAFGALEWKSPLEREHPLVGYALSTRDERWVDAAEIRAALAKAEFVFLGETHDNEDHHRLQAAFLEAALAGGKRPALAFEMLDTSQAGTLAAALAVTPVTPDAIAEATGWKKSGWPEFALYRPIFEIRPRREAGPGRRQPPSSGRARGGPQGGRGAPRRRAGAARARGRAGARGAARLGQGDGGEPLRRGSEGAAARPRPGAAGAGRPDGPSGRRRGRWRWRRPGHWRRARTDGSRRACVARARRAWPPASIDCPRRGGRGAPLAAPVRRAVRRGPLSVRLRGLHATRGAGGPLRGAA